jgi:exonuclease SbcC
MLLGVNEDDNGSNSNGSGKSTIIEAITLAITGDVYRGVSKEDYISYGEDFCFVDFELRNDILNQSLQIKRRVYSSSKSAKLEIYIDGEFPKEIPTSTNGGIDVRIGSKQIFEIIGISKEDFLNYYVIGQGNRNSFFTANDTKQKEIISRFSNFLEIDQLIDHLSKEDKRFDSELQSVHSNINSCDELITYFKEDISEIKGNFKQTKEQEISNKKIEIKEVNEKTLKVAEKVRENEKKIEDKRLELSKIIPIDNSKVESQIKKIRNQISDIDLELRESNKLLSGLNSKTGEIIECPKCDHKFIPDEELSVDDINDNISSLEELIQSSVDEKDLKEKRLKQYKQELLKSDELKSKKSTLDNEIYSYVEIKDNQLDNLENYKKRLKRLLNELVEINKKSLKDQICEIESKLTKQVEKKELFLESYNEIQLKKDENQFHLFHFGKKGFKTYLANKSIRTIQDICNFYLQKFETNLQVQMSGFTVLKSGEVRDKIEISVLKNGLNKGLFDKYSGGEKSRVDIAGIIAINRLINNGCGDKGLNLLILDENVSYLDSSGQSEVIKILSKSKITTLLVMHQVDDIPYKNKVVIRKENNNSVILSK